MGTSEPKVDAYAHVFASHLCKHQVCSSKLRGKPPFSGKTWVCLAAYVSRPLADYSYMYYVYVGNKGNNIPHSSNYYVLLAGLANVISSRAEFEKVQTFSLILIGVYQDQILLQPLLTTRLLVGVYRYEVGPKQILASQISWTSPYTCLQEKGQLIFVPVC